MTIDKGEGALLLLAVGILVYRYAIGRWPVAVDVEEAT
jgi:hypothetical protein